ncbi:MAG: hypothetical protein ACR2NJ_06640, partial [Acidimicrobiales bacterium]
AQVRELLDRSAQELSGRASEQTDKTATNLREVAGELHALAEGRPDQATRVVGYVRQVADRSEQYADRLGREGFGAVSGDLSRFARRRPGLFLLSAAAAGFAAGPSDPRGPGSQRRLRPHTPGFGAASLRLPAHRRGI